MLFVRSKAPFCLVSEVKDITTGTEEDEAAFPI
jgi:hypothetical protein